MGGGGMIRGEMCRSRKIGKGVIKLEYLDFKVGSLYSKKCIL